MATATAPCSPLTERMAVAGWISGGTGILLAALFGAGAAAQIRFAATLLGEAWFGAGLARLAPLIRKETEGERQ